MTYLATFPVTSAAGTPLTAIHLPPGAWAAFPSAVSDKPMVEFYDTRYDHTIFGQFTGGRYHVETLLDGPCQGLIMGSDLAWTIKAMEMVRVRDWLRGLS